MKKILTLLLAGALSMGVAMAQGQAIIKSLGKPVTGMISTPDGNLIQSGSVLELNQGTTAEGNYKFIYTVIGMTLAPLGYGADYDKVMVKELRYQNKSDTYFALVDIATATYIVEIDKAVKSGEIKSISSSSN